MVVAPPPVFFLLPASLLPKITISLSSFVHPAPVSAVFAVIPDVIILVIPIVVPLLVSVVTISVRLRETLGVLNTAGL
jgi:hypothetical protein